MTEQNYADPGQSEPVSQIQVQELQRRNAELLERIVALEQQVADLQTRLALAQGGVPTPL
jgi:hypothetical protein